MKKDNPHNQKKKKGLPILIAQQLILKNIAYIWQVVKLLFFL
jgi:hypothetical protein